jgi:hypothetical protein
LAQWRTLPSHGKIKLDSYNALLRDVHPASQAQANVLQNRLFWAGLKKVERLERKDRLDAYDERQFIDILKNYDRVVQRLAAGRPTSARNLATFWLLVSVFGDHAEVYEALASDMPRLPDEDFVPSSKFIQILQPSGELEPLPLWLDVAEEVDASDVQSAWSALVRELNSTGRMSSQGIVNFRSAVNEYRQQCARVIQDEPHHSGRFEAKKHLSALRELADALYRRQQRARILQYLEDAGYAFEGYSTLELIQHMLRNDVTPAQGSTAQLALAEVARPISRVLEQEIALRIERIDSLATGEGHRPYAAEYRRHDEPTTEVPNMGISSWTP